MKKEHYKALAHFYIASGFLVRISAPLVIQFWLNKAASLCNSDKLMEDTSDKANSLIMSLLWVFHITPSDMNQASLACHFKYLY